MPQRPEPHAITETIRVCREQLDIIERTYLPTLVALARARSEAATSLVQPNYDSDGRGGSESTPVERAAAMRASLLDLERQLTRRYSNLLDAFTQMQSALAKANHNTGCDPTIEMANDADGFCVNCAKYGVQSIRDRGARCDPCYVYRGRNNMADRPRELVILHERRRQRVGSLDRRHMARGRGVVEGV